MYVMYVEDLDEEDKDENQKENTSEANLQTRDEPLMTQSIYLANSLRNSQVRFTERTQKPSNADDDPVLVESSKDVDEEKKTVSSLMYDYRTSVKNEAIWSESKQTSESAVNLESEGNRMYSGRPEVSFQSTSGEYSVSKSSNGELLIVVDGKLFRHVKEEDIEDTLSQKTSRKFRTTDPREKSPPRYKEKATVDFSSSQVTSKRDSGRLLMAFVASKERRQGPADHGTEIGSKTQTVRFEDWLYDAEQVKISKASKSQADAELIAKPSAGDVLSTRSDEHAHQRYSSQKAKALKYISDHQRYQFDQYRNSNKRSTKGYEQATATEKHSLETKCRDAKLRLHRTESRICDCAEWYAYRDERKRVHHKGSNISQQSDESYRCECHCANNGLKGWQLSTTGFEQTQDTASANTGRKQKCNCGCESKTKRSNAVSRRKRCEYENEGPQNYAIHDTSSKNCDRIDPFGSKLIPSSSALPRKTHSLSRGSSCSSKDRRSTGSDDVSHPKPVPDSPDEIPCPQREIKQDLMPRALKVDDSHASREERGRPIPAACIHRVPSDFEETLLKTEDGPKIVQSLLIDKDNRPNLQIIGEIAGQLEFRIVQYVFAGLDRKSSYGMFNYTHTDCVRNIPEVIERHCFDREARKVNVPLHFRLVKRFAYIKTSLRPFGYDFDFHPQFSIDMVNKYGRLDPSGAQTKFQLSPIDLDVRKDLSSFIEATCPSNEAEHVSVLLDCLLLLASDDAKSLFIWESE